MSFNLKEWLDKNNFDKEGNTYVYFKSDSYKVKDTLKEAGFKFNKVLKWHIAEVPSEYEDSVVRVNIRDICEITDDVYFYGDADQVINELIKQKKGVSNSEWIGNISDRFREVKVKVESIIKTMKMNIIVFITEEGDIIKWITKATPPYEYEGKYILLTATVKEHIIDDYENGAKVTLISRAVFKYID